MKGLSYACSSILKNQPSLTRAGIANRFTTARNDRESYLSCQMRILCILACIPGCEQRFPRRTEMTRASPLSNTSFAPVRGLDLGFENVRRQRV